MIDFPKPIVIVSKCLGFARCRYNGQTIPNRIVERLGFYVEYRPVCPEVEIGLGIPRDPVRIVDDRGKRLLYQPATGKDATEEMNVFTGRFLGSVVSVDGFIMKNRSPSCCPWDVKVYNGMGKNVSSTRGNGFFGGKISERYPGKPIEDESRLNNFLIREHFLTRLFALARLRSIISYGRSRSMGALVDFHARYKYLLMAYCQTQLKLLGNIVANRESASLDEVHALYGAHFEKALSKTPRPGQLINVLLHAYGGLSKRLTPEERRFFLNGI
jgi:uncharacterized protein YbbK (DUF523 family)/uncharacterized protein YbgA (DUF1722 family)